VYETLIYTQHGRQIFSFIPRDTLNKWKVVRWISNKIVTIGRYNSSQTLLHGWLNNFKHCNTSLTVIYSPRIQENSKIQKETKFHWQEAIERFQLSWHMKTRKCQIPDKYPIRLQHWLWWCEQTDCAECTNFRSCYLLTIIIWMQLNYL